MKTLEERAPEILPLYRLVGKDVLRLAREKSGLDEAKAARLDALFSSAGGHGSPGANGGRPRGA